MTFSAFRYSEGMTLQSSLGAALRRLRTDLGLTLDEVRSRTGFTPASVSRWETGSAVNGVPADKLEALAALYGFGVRVDLVRGAHGSRVKVVEQADPVLHSAVEELESLLHDADAATIERVLFAARFAVAQRTTERKASGERD